jgi:hypothetical protein
MATQVSSALQWQWNMSNTYCVAIHDYLVSALNDGRIKYYDIHIYDGSGNLLGGDAHWDQSRFDDPTGAIHLDANQFGGGYNLAYILAHEGSHIVYNIAQDQDAEAVGWGNTCSTL